MKAQKEGERLRRRITELQGGVVTPGKKDRTLAVSTPKAKLLTEDKLKSTPLKECNQAASGDKENL